MTLDDTVWMVKDEVRNYFNSRNSPEDPPEDTESPMYKRFLSLCAEIHRGIESGELKPSAIVSESMLNGKHSYTKAAGQDGMPIGWEKLYARRLNPFRRMFTS